MKLLNKTSKNCDVKIFTSQLLDIKFMLIQCGMIEYSSKNINDQTDEHLHAHASSGYGLLSQLNLAHSENDQMGSTCTLHTNDRLP